MLVLDEADIAKLLDMDAALAAVRTALLDVYRGTARNLVKERTSLDGQTLHSTSAVLRTGPMGPVGPTGPMRSVGSTGGVAREGAAAESPASAEGQGPQSPASAEAQAGEGQAGERPEGAGGDAARTWHGATVYVSGSVRAHWTLVFNGDEGLCAVVAGKTLARLRTDAASGVSADALARPGPITLACIGAGYQAWTQVEAVSRVRPIGRLLVWSRTRERAEGFAAQVRDGLGLPATPVAAVADAVAGADVVTAATKARDPVIRGAGIRLGTHVVLAGSSHADRREADTDLFARAAAVFTDDLDLARAHSGDLRTAVADGALGWDDVRHLGAALDGTEARPSARPDSGAITVFCSHGVGSWDLELARTALERAEAAGAGQRLGLDMGRWRDGM